MKESFVFYKSFYEASKFLSDEEKGRLFDMICQYGLYGNEVEGTGPAMGMFLLIKPQLDANYKRYVNGCKGGAYGKLGGRPKKTWDNSQKPQDNPNLTPNDNDNDNVNENEKENMSTGDSLNIPDNIKEKKEKVPPKERKEKKYCEEFEYLRKTYPHWKGRGSKPNSYRKWQSWTEEERQKILDKAKEKRVCCECGIDNKQYSKAFEGYMENERGVDFDLESFVNQLMENKKDKDNVGIKLAKEYWGEDVVQKFVKRYVLTHDTMTLNLH